MNAVIRMFQLDRRSQPILQANLEIRRLNLMLSAFQGVAQWRRADIDARRI